MVHLENEKIEMNKKLEELEDVLHEAKKKEDEMADYQKILKEQLDREIKNSVQKNIEEPVPTFGTTESGRRYHNSDEKETKRPKWPELKPTYSTRKIDMKDKEHLDRSLWNENDSGRPTPGRHAENYNERYGDPKDVPKWYDIKQGRVTPELKSPSITQNRHSPRLVPPKPAFSNHKPEMRIEENRDRNPLLPIILSGNLSNLPDEIRKAELYPPFSHNPHESNSSNYQGGGGKAPSNNLHPGSLSVGSNERPSRTSRIPSHLLVDFAQTAKALLHVFDTTENITGDPALMADRELNRELENRIKILELRNSTYNE